MRLESLLPLFLFGSFIPGCRDTEPNPIGPFLDEWQERVAEPQLLRTPEGDYDVTTLRIGGLGVGDKNFFNRGDVVVLYDATPGKMVIDIRKFAHAESQEDADDIYAHLNLWLSDANFDKPPPHNELALEERCDIGTWRDGCGIRTWYDGLTQRVQAGMDLRVHLPPDFLAAVIVTTEDNDHDDDYHNRGNVCLWDVPASATINLERGQALVKLADDIVTTPTCSAQNIAACDETDWAADCPCRALGLSPSAVTIEGVGADVAIAVPSTTWADVWIENRAGLLPTGDHCVASIDVPGAILEPGDFAWKQTGDIAPRDNELGALSIRAFSNECGPVDFVENPDMFSRGGEPPLDPRRGDITICEGCIQNQSCDDFLEDGLRLSN